MDVVNFGEDSSNTEKLNVFVTTLNGKEGQTSHLITVPPGTGTALSDVLFSSPIVRVRVSVCACPCPTSPSQEYESEYESVSEFASPRSENCLSDILFL